MKNTSRNTLMRRRIIFDAIYLLFCLVGIVLIAVTGHYWLTIVPILALILGIFILRYHLKEFSEKSK